MPQDCVRRRSVYVLRCHSILDPPHIPGAVAHLRYVLLHGRVWQMNVLDLVVFNMRKVATIAPRVEGCLKDELVTCDGLIHSATQELIIGRLPTSREYLALAD